MSQANPVQSAIETKLHAELQPSLLEVAFLSGIR